MVNEWMRGIYSSEDINRLIAKELNTSFEEVWNIFVSDCKNMNISVDVLHRIDHLRKNYHAILITDNMDCFTRFTVPALKINSYFDSMINSFDNKTFKSDHNGEIFLQVVNERGSKVEDCILIDNSKSACDTFSKLGGSARFVTSEKPLAFWLENVENELVRT